jgi:hypothetical protein
MKVLFSFTLCLELGKDEGKKEGGRKVIGIWIFPSFGCQKKKEGLIKFSGSHQQNLSSLKWAESEKSVIFICFDKNNLVNLSIYEHMPSSLLVFFCCTTFLSCICIASNLGYVCNNIIQSHFFHRQFFLCIPLMVFIQYICKNKLYITYIILMKGIFVIY